ncbi:hypothetical protein B7P43_G11573 [Cryptotermes secundus]|uniref:Uncharacterized protein n=1 Tax=Cryptotermes secundus TaxID=105785 RepID=A0A2J7R7G3_9NEOP|nr:hypothetical protein B7P43_G11573 [Cryptotermes secundus]
MGRACNMHGEKKKAYRIFVGKPEGKRPPGRLGCWWENNSVKTDLREIGWSGVIWFRTGTSGWLL